MPKQFRAILITVITLVLITLGILAVTKKSSKPEPAKDDAQVTMMQPPDQSKKEDAPQADQPAAGSYLDYNEKLAAVTPGVRILFFHAPWCPQCRQLETDIKAGSIPAGVTIFKVDYDTNQKLRQKYGVTIQTTLVKLGEGDDLAKKFVAYDDPTLASLQKNLL